MGSAFMHGWVGLPTRGEVYLEHGVPREVRVDLADTAAVDIERLVDEIDDVTSLRVTLDRWEQIEDGEGMQAMVRVDAGDIAEVMRRLALATAETFYDRYHKAMDAEDTDFDDEAYAQDFDIALDACGLRRGQINMDALRAGYRAMLHGAIERMAKRH